LTIYITYFPQVAEVFWATFDSRLIG
jgi:hypothetical protein